eukprot:gene9434-9244_t
MRLALIPLAVAAVLAMGAAPPISARGAGPIRVGMTYEEAHPFIAEALGDGDSPTTCIRYVVKGYPNLDFMVEAGRVTRVTAYGPGLATPEGIEAGDPEAEVRAAYGSRLRRYDPDWGEGHALYVMQTPTTGLLFWIDDQGDVAAIHAGQESIRYEEGCA